MLDYGVWRAGCAQLGAADSSCDGGGFSTADEVCGDGGCVDCLGLFL